jgi:hypothetical protein
MCFGVVAATVSWLVPVAAARAHLVRVAMLSLSKSDRYGRIAVVSGRDMLYSSDGLSPQYPSTLSTCSSAVVNPATRALSDFAGKPGPTRRCLAGR